MLSNKYELSYSITHSREPYLKWLQYKKLGNKHYPESFACGHEASTSNSSNSQSSPMLRFSSQLNHKPNSQQQRNHPSGFKHQAITKIKYHQ